MLWLVASAALATAACEDDGADETTDPEQTEPPEPVSTATAPDDEGEQAAADPEGDSEAPAAIPDEAYGSYELDPVHSQLVFRGGHFGFSHTYAMFNGVEGSFELAKEASESEVQLEVPTASLFSGHKKRDEDLKGPDFLNVGQFPKLTFESQKVTETGGGFEIEGELTIRGETRTVSIPMKHVGSGKFPMDGSYRTGFHGETTIDRTEFGIDYLADKGLPAEIHIIASIEGKKK